MGSQSIAGQKPIHKTISDQFGKGTSGISIKSTSWSHNPHNFTISFFVFKQSINGIVIFGVRRFSGAPLPEGKGFMVFTVGTKAIGMNKDTLVSVFTATHYYQVAFFNMTKFHNFYLFISINCNAIHTTFFSQKPFAMYLKIFRKNRHGMIVIWGNT